MIQTIGDTEKFIKDGNDAIYIYGAGNCGKWTARLMQKCGIEFEAFIDKAAVRGCSLYGKKVIHPSSLVSLAGKSRVKIIIANAKPWDSIANLHYYADSCNILCLIPIYNNVDGHQTVFVNKMLGYFRRQLITTKMPTIIANSCAAAVLYSALGSEISSPTINLNIEPEDFIKICKNPREYLSEDIRFDHWSVSNGGVVPIGKIKDVEVIFSHASDAEEAVNDWNRRRQRINWDNLVYIMEDSNYGRILKATDKVDREFNALSEKHLRILCKSYSVYPERTDAIYMEENYFYRHDFVMENWFDPVAWVNGE